MEADESNKIPILRWTIIMLKMMGAYTTGPKIIGSITMLSFSLFILQMILDLILNWTGVETLKRIVYLPSVFVSSIKGGYLIFKSKELMQMVGTLNQFWRTDKFGGDTQPAIDKIFVQVSRVWKGYVLMIGAFCGGMTALPWLDPERKSMILTDFAFCDLQGNFACWIANYVWQSFFLLCQGVPAAIGFDLIFIIFIAYVFVGCELIKVALTKLNIDDFERRQAILKKIVDQHDFILMFVKTMDEMFMGVMFMQFACTVWSMFLTLYMMAANGLPPKPDDASYFGSLYIIFISQLFLYASSGTIVEHQIRSLSKYIFMVDWYQSGSTKLRQDLALMICRSQNARLLSAGKMTNLNFELYISTLKASLSVFTLVWQVSNAGNENQIKF